MNHGYGTNADLSTLLPPLEPRTPCLWSVRFRVTNTLFFPVLCLVLLSAALTPRDEFANLHIQGNGNSSATQQETKQQPKALDEDDDAPTMNENEVGDLLNEAASSMPTFGKPASSAQLPQVPDTTDTTTSTTTTTTTTEAKGTTTSRTPMEGLGLHLSSKKIVPHLDISDNPSEVFVTKFSPDGKMLAAGCGDGAVRVFDAETGKLNYNLNITANALPTTALTWRPVTESSRTRNVLIAANADGAVQHWHVTSGRCLHEINDPENSLFTIDYSADGKKFATAGKDYAVRIYDEATKTLVSKMEGGYHAIQKGHSNRVFSLKFDKNDDNVVVSGGWDNTVQVWDLRTERSVRSFYGPHICGDAIDICGGTILTGSYRMDEQLQTWDFGTGKLIDNISWGNSSTQLYAACFDPSGTLIGAGGAGKNEAKIFDRTAGNALVGTVAGLSRGVYSIDFNHDGSKFVVGGGDATVRLFSVQERKT